MRDGNRLEYARRVERVIDHIRGHLADELSLAALARVAAFSPFHFHRVFKAITGETLFGFIQRLRIERAAVALRDHADQSVLAVALDHGFSSAAAFARAFRARFGMSATEWRRSGAGRSLERHRRAVAPGRRPRKRDQPIGKHGKARTGRGGETSRKRKEEVAMNVRVTTLPGYPVAYMRHVGPYGAHGIPELWERFHRWRQTRDLMSSGSITLGIGHDDPSVTAPERCRYDACVVVPADFTLDRWVNVTDIPGGKYAVAEFVGGPGEIQAAWDHVFRTWLPGGGWQPDDRACLEVYRGNPSVDGAPGTFRCELCLPVRPL